MDYNIEDIYSLSPMQQGMLFHSLLNKEKSAYFEQLSCEIKGEFSPEVFCQAWNTVVKRHSILRSAFIWEDVEQPLQVVFRSVRLPFEVLDWTELDDKEAEEKFQEALSEDIKKGFDLTNAPLMRIKLIARKDNSYNFIWSHHHIISDGWGMQIIIKEVFEIYESIVKNQELKQRSPRPYKDYISWLERQDLKAAEKFWRERLSGFYLPTLIAGFADKPNGSASGYSTFKTSVGIELTQALNNLSKQYQLTLNTIIQGAWALLLHFLSGEDDVVFGATVSGRPLDLPNSENIAGLFINTLPVRVKFNRNAAITDWLKELQIGQAQTLQYEYTPLFELQKWTDLPKGSSLFDNIIVFENYPIDKSLNERNSLIKISNLHTHSETNYPVTFVVSPGKELSFEIAYDGSIFSLKNIESISEHLKNILLKFTEDPQRQLHQTDILSNEEETEIIIKWNATEAPLPDELLIHKWFEKCAEKSPDSIALNYNGETLSYGQLNEKANKLAKYLIKKGAGPEVIIGISVERSFEMIIGILGILKSGAAYLPLDPFYPEERLKYMVKDSAAAILVTKEKYRGLFPGNITAVTFENEWAEIEKESGGNPEEQKPRVLDQNLAYVIYTSGSTGRPKGTLIEHRNFCNFIKRLIDDFPADSNSRVLQFASFSFDASVAEIFLGILSGATLYLADREKIISVDDLSELLKKEKITAATLPPTVLNILENKDLEDFKTIFSVGDACNWSIVEKWGYNHRFFNGYGPTEATVGAAWLNVSQNIYNTHTVPVGKAIKNAKIYILDKNLNPLPEGLTGQIYIGGTGVARGYLFQPGMTAEKFIPDPFSNIPGSRLYKTGDLGRFLQDGIIEFKGRVDNQVKIRGFRVELEEIESALRALSCIKDCAVIDKPDNNGNKRIAAYFIAQEDNQPEISLIKDQLSGKLPDFMIPSVFIQMKSFPLTPNGKLDRKALPEPGGSDDDQPEGQLNETEELIANIWKSVLKVKKVTRKDNFFELGGHSLSATQVLSRIRDIFKIELPLEKLFSSKDLEELARIVSTYLNNNEEILTQIKKVSRAQDLKLSFSQQRLWFVEKLRPGGSSYNIPSAVKISGRFDFHAFECAVNDLVERHETLRTSFIEKGGRPYLNIAEKHTVHPEFIDLSSQSSLEHESRIYEIIETAAGIPFDLSKLPLFKFIIIKLENNEHIFISVMHHIISDGWSVGIFFNELKALYENYLKNDENIKLPEMQLQYADYAQWQQELMSADLYTKELQYWKEQLGDIPQMLQMSTDKPRPSVQTINGETVSIFVNDLLRQKLQKLSIERGVTLYMLMLSVFQLLLHKYTGQDDIVVGTPIAGRIQTKLENIIGFFVNNLAIRCRFDQLSTFNELVDNIRQVTLDAYKNQHIPFDKLVEELQPERDLSHSPIFQVMFVFQNLPVEMKKSDLINLAPLPIKNNTSNFDFSMTVAEASEGLNIEIGYNTDLFFRTTMERMLKHYENLLEIITSGSEEYISDMDFLNKDERIKLISEWNKTDALYPDNMCAHEWFEKISEEEPLACALRYRKDEYTEAAQLSYSELNKRANKFANYLTRYALHTESLVGIMTDRSVEMIIAILGVLKSGWAFVPIDPSNPEERISYIIKDANISLVIVNGEVSQLEKEENLRLLNISSQWSEIEKESDSYKSEKVSKDNLAYVIYTSGSTGRPKGTMLQHQGLCNLASCQREIFKLQKGSKVMQFSSLSFDASVWEIVMALLSGATLVLTSKDVITSGESLARVMEQEEVSIVTLPPSVLSVLPQKSLKSLSTIVTAGEAVSKELVSKWSNGRRFFNAYGPTETTVCASIYLCSEVLQKDPPIGRPLGNFKLYVVDKNYQLCGIGIPGELCVEGVGLARGYLNRADLTAEKFIPNPFSSKKGARLYRTGDLVKYNEDGNIEYLGRIDHQVKIRGFRIELGEIETALHQHEKIKDAIVIARTDQSGKKIVAAYYVAESDKEIDNGELKIYLKKILPEYMIPSAFIALDKMPLNISGKIDLKALPDPLDVNQALMAEYVAPKTETEERVVNIINDLLSLRRTAGIMNSFFELGGHSLLATQLISRIREELHVEIPLRSLFEKPVISELSLEIEKIKNEKYKDSVVAKVKRESSDEPRVFPLSYAQRRMWFLDQFEPGSPYYNIPMAYRIRGEFNADIFRTVISKIVQRHESLRTVFREIDSKPYQVIFPSAEPSLSLIDLRSMDKDSAESEAERLTKEEARKPFDISNLPLMRVTVIRISEDESIALLTMHHIISDGWSIGVLVKEISTLYRAFVLNEESSLPEMEYQYIDYSNWQKQYLEGEILNSQLEYWKKQLSDKPPLLEIPTDRSRPQVWTNEGSTMSMIIPKELTGLINKLCRQENSTLFMVLITALNILLHKYSNDDDITIGTPIANRTRKEFEDIIGLFINTLVLRTSLKGDPGFNELLNRVREVTISSYENQDLPFELLVEQLQPDRNMSYPPLFQVMFILQNSPQSIQIVPGISMQTIDVEMGTSTTDLTFSAAESSEGLKIDVEYNTDLFFSSTIERMLKHFRNILESIAKDPMQKLSEISLFGDLEFNKVIYEWNNYSAERPENTCIHHLFEKQVLSSGDNIAIVSNGDKLTYNELNIKANKLAHKLIQMSVKPEDAVAICIDRSADMMVSVLAVLKAGGAYLPLDSQYPEDRLEFMLSDAKVKVLITQESLLGILPAYSGKIILIDSDHQEIEKESGENPEVPMDEKNIAYLIYTSGSTGKPKGTMVPHFSLVNAALSWQDAYELKTRGRNHLQMASFSFDVFSGDWTRALCSGGKLVITPREILLDGEKLYNLMKREEVNIAEFVPAVLRNLIDYLENTNKKLDFFNLLIAGSDIWYVGEYKKFRRFCGDNTRLINSFGLTEATIDSSYYEADDLTLSDDRLVPIGKPFANMSLYILNKNLLPVPIGVRGELYVGGLGVSRGYLNRPDVTAERFIPDPFSKDSQGQRLYKTGDMARFLEDGNVEFLGRIDNQVKLRGFRVELGEIESALTDLDFVKDAVVSAREDKPGNKRLVAYLVLSEDEKRDVNFKRILSDKLPDYMIPSAFVILDKLPLTPNGKVDRKALPQPEEPTAEEVMQNYVPPQNQVEQFIANIWSDVLDVENIGIYNNFFDLGGHSLLAAQVISRIKDTFKVEVPLRSIFENQTISQLSRAVERAKAARSGLIIPPLKKVSREEYLPLSFAQQRLWFLEQLEPGSPFYNIPEIYKIKGSLNIKVLEESINQIIRRHEILRTVFLAEKGIPEQVIIPELKINVAVTDLTEHEEELRNKIAREIADREIKTPINITNAPLFRFSLIKLNECECIILLIIHHIISDEWSTGVIFKEIAQIYESLISGRAPEIEELPVQYADFACWQREWLQGEVLEGQLNYWKNKLEGIVPLIDLPIDHQRPSVQTFNGDFVTFELSREFSNLIQNTCRSENTTLYMFLMAAFQLMLYKYSGQEDFCIGTTIANRNFTEIEALIGFFVNTLVIRNDASKDITFKDLLQKVKETSLEAYTYQDIPFEQVVEAVQPERDLSHSPLFQVMLVIQNAASRKNNIRSSQFEVQPVEAHSGTAKFDLTLFMLEDNDHISGAFEYNTDLFEKRTIEKMIGHFVNILEAITENLNKKLLDISLTDKLEEKQIMSVLNDVPGVDLIKGFVHEMIECQAKLNPDKTAVISESRSLSFDELNRQANQLAHLIIKHGVTCDKAVGILLERSEDLIIALLGALKSGGTYVPVEAAYPDERVKYIIRDSLPKVIITQRKYQERLKKLCAECSTDTRLIFIDDEFDENESNPEVKISGDNLCYIIYTSGSTGNPKGVMVTHEGLRNYLSWAVHAYPIDEGNGSIVHSTAAFDATVTAIYPALIKGKSVAVVPEGNDIELLGKTLEERKNFSLVKITPAHLEILVNQLSDKDISGITKSFVIGGENLTYKQIEQWQKRSPGTLLFNEYGPTETVVGCIVFEASRQNGNVSVPIGRVIPNVEIYVLDRSMQPIPIGVSGELYIGGAGVARGYLNRADLTASSFVPDPFSKREGARLYRTGDLVKVLNDGNLEFLGRIDNQVKIRGFRIELGEIESQLAQYPGIRDSIVLIKEKSNNDKTLTACCLKGNFDNYDIKAIKEFLRTRLPEYMIPQNYLFLDEFPLTGNGKVDRKALLALKGNDDISISEYIAPKTELEKMMSELWKELLGKEKIGVNDNFFETGGHSLLAARLIANVNKILNIGLPIRAIFDHPGLGSFSLIAESAMKSSSLPQLPPISKAEKREDLPLSFSQQRLWFLDQLNPGQPIYNMPQSLRLKGKLNHELLNESLNVIINRHESLRTVFADKNGIPVQVILPEVKESIDIIDLSGIAENKIEDEALRIIKDEAQRPFNLSQGPLIRLSLLKLKEEDHILLITLHHIISDGWSINVLIEEAVTVYSALLEGKEPKLKELEIQYADYSNWQQKYLYGDILDNQLSFWKNVLEGAPKLLEIPTDYPRPAMKTFNGAHESFTLDDGTVRMLYRTAQDENVTPFMILLGAFQIFLSRYSGQDDICVGTPVANRNHPKTESLIGFFANTIVMRLKLGGKESFKEVLNKVRKLTLDALTFQDIPFERLVDLLNPERDMSYTPIFQVMFVLQNQQKKMKMENLVVIPIESQVSSTQYDITLSMEESSKHWAGTFEYNTDLFNKETIKRMISHFKQILNSLLCETSLPVALIPVVSAEELEKVTFGTVLKDKYQDYIDKTSSSINDITVLELFNLQVQKNPYAAALSFEGQSLTYKELNERSNRLAHYLIEKGAGPDKIVAIMAERSMEMVISLLSVLKAGGAYLPVDPNYPVDRINYIIEDSAVNIILSEERLKDRITNKDLNIIALDNLWEEIKDKADTEPCVNICINNLAYVIYTSGSTGKPKGVMLEHKGLTNLVTSQIKDFAISSQSRLLQFASSSFDASVSEIFTALLSGAELHLTKREKLISADELSNLLRSEEISVVTLPPAMLDILPENNFPSLKTVVSAGDRLSRETGIRWAKGLRFINAYGPTEATVGSSMYIVKGDEETQSMPIGRPIENARLYVLDKNMMPVPVGVPGELYIGGMGLARGYINKAELTAERFVPDPFSTFPGARLYRTGDLVKCHPDGNIEFLGRIDNQIKLRGFRIELEEIESVIKLCPGISQVSVVLTETKSGSKAIVAYYSTEIGRDITSDEISQFAAQNLPEYMLPSAFIMLGEMPMLENGKIDKKTLARYEYLEHLSAENYQKPHSLTEELLASIWMNLLKVEKAGIYSNFFELGGHSLLATQLVSRIKESFEVTVPLSSVFEHPVLSELASEIDRMKSEKLLHIAEVIMPADRSQLLPLSFAQQRLWFLDQYEPESPVYNLPTVLRIKGELKTEVFAASIKKLIERHEVLRTIFLSDEGKAQQIILPEIDLPLELLDLSADSSTDNEDVIREIAAREIQCPFNLSQGPLFRIKLVQLGQNDFIFIVVMHHIISDGWSMSVMVSEITELYGAELNNSEAHLPELKLQYADYASWQRQWLNGEVLDAHRKYWSSHLEGIPDLLKLPLDHQRPPVQTFKGMTISFEIEKELSSALREIHISENSTLFMLLLSSFNLLLYRYSDQDDIVVGTPVANRNSVEMEKLIGFFVNTLAIRSKINPEMTFRQFLSQTRSATIGAYAHQSLPFEMLVDILNPQRDLSYSPVFQVMFVLQNLPFQQTNISGLNIYPLGFDSPVSKFDLTLSVMESSDGLTGNFEFNPDLFEEQTIQRMIKHFKHLLKEVALNPDKKLHEIKMLDEKEESILISSNIGKQTKSNFKPVFESFEENLRYYPDNFAVRYENKTITFSELNKRSNKLAHYLVEQGVHDEVIVSVMTERSIEMIISILAILKAGGAYLPVDPSYPKGRIEYILNDSAAQIILTQKSLGGNPVSSNASVIYLDNIWDEVEKRPSYRPLISIDKDNLAYVIYTSGSTGLPKGVMLSHKGLSSLVEAQIKDFQINSSSRLLQFASCGFDASVSEIFTALVSGAELYLAPKEKLTASDELFELLRSQEISVVTLPPSLLSNLPEEILPEMKTIVSAGERCPKEAAQKWSKNLRFINAYGPTEATVCASSYLVNGEESAQSIPIGKAIDNTKLYILGRSMNPVPQGVTGELYIGGIGLARGYINKTDMTAEKFVPNPFASEIGERLYRTGDLVRMDSSGNIEFLGRRDNQVKLRGFRIELGEIENVLSCFPGIADAAVLINDRSNKTLVAYCKTKEGQNISIASIREFLKTRLPEYMIPANYVFMNEFPITGSGKVDIKVLMHHTSDIQSLKQEYAAPETKKEKILSELFAQILNKDQVGINDNFFEMGGDSILSIQVVSRADMAGIKLRPKDIFQYPTVRELARAASDSAKKSPDNNDLPKGDIPLTPIQHSFFDHYRLRPEQFNSSMYLELFVNLDIKLLEKTIKILIENHDSLRLCFVKENNEWKQRLKDIESLMVPESPKPFLCFDFSAFGSGEQKQMLRSEIKRLENSFVLSEGFLFRVAYFNLGIKSKPKLVFIFHHLITDPVSWRIIIDEFLNTYISLSGGSSDISLQRSSSYYEWAFELSRYSNSPQLLSELNYWSNLKNIKLPELKFDHPGGISTYGTMDNVTSSISAELTAKLMHEAADAFNASLKDILIAVLYNTLSGWLKSKDILLEMNGHGREDLFADLNITRTLGWFTSTFPVYLKADDQDDISKLIDSVKRSVGSIPNNGFGFNVLKYLSADPSVREVMNNIPEALINFNYLGQFDQITTVKNVPFKIAGELTEFEQYSEERTSSLLYIVCIISGGALHTRWLYSRNLFKAGTIKKLAKTFTVGLQKIAKHM